MQSSRVGWSQGARPGQGPDPPRRINPSQGLCVFLHPFCFFFYFFLPLFSPDAVEPYWLESKCGPWYLPRQIHPTQRLCVFLHPFLLFYFFLPPPPMQSSRVGWSQCAGLGLHRDGCTLLKVGYSDISCSSCQLEWLRQVISLRNSPFDNIVLPACSRSSTEVEPSTYFSMQQPSVQKKKAFS